MDDYANFLFLGRLREAEKTVRGALDKLDHWTMRLRYCFYDFLMMLDRYPYEIRSSDDGLWARRWRCCSVVIFSCLSYHCLLISLLRMESPTGWASARAWRTAQESLDCYVMGKNGYWCSLNRKDTPGVTA